jgi:hypothetical protein
MKCISLAITFLTLFTCNWAQENRVTLSGGYVFANLEEVETNTSGWRINALYEFNPHEGMFAHGLSFGFMSNSAEYTSLAQATEYKINSWPIYYAPKVMFGKNAFKVFIKGALGLHISSLTRSGSLGDLSSNDTGFYGGASAGLMYKIGEMIFINAEYEWAYLSNSYYRDGFINSAMGGIGFMF